MSFIGLNYYCPIQRQIWWGSCVTEGQWEMKMCQDEILDQSRAERLIYWVGKGPNCFLKHSNSVYWLIWKYKSNINNLFLWCSITAWKVRLHFQLCTFLYAKVWIVESAAQSVETRQKWSEISRLIVEIKPTEMGRNETFNLLKTDWNNKRLIAVEIGLKWL